MTTGELTLMTLDLREPRDVATARQRTQALTQRLGFEVQDQVRLAAAVSEVSRHVLQLARPVQAAFLIEGAGAGAALAVVISGPRAASAGLDDGPDANRPASPDLAGARRLVDRFEIDPTPGNEVAVRLARALPRRGRPPTPEQLAQVAEEMARLPLASPVDELLRQNRDQLRLLNELRARELELDRLNRELEETNRGVVALYTELDERADSLRRASELKTRFLSNVSHEFRTPLTSILSLSRLLLDGEDGPINDEQGRQVRYILRAAHDLLGMVNDLLDLARIEAGREDLMLGEIALPEFFGLMRGMLRPLIAEGSPVELHFEVEPGVRPLFTDEGKLAQVVRNLVSNALKFTEAGEVRVRADLLDSETLRIAVSDTGVGIDPADFERIFEEFGQVHNPLQARSKGTGLGLPLALRLTQLLGGTLEVASRPGVGSTFTVCLPLVGTPPGDPEPETDPLPETPGGVDA